MINNNTTYSELDFNFLIGFVKKSHFFVDLEHDPRDIKIRNFLSKEIDIKHIDLPLCIYHYAIKNNIKYLAELLNVNPASILKYRNLGKKNIIKAQKIILSYLFENQDFINNICKKIDSNKTYFSNNSIEKYYPLLQDTYKTTEFYYQYINKDVDYIKIPKHIKNFIKDKPNIVTLNDLLNLDYNELIRIENIGRKTINKLQYTLIDLLGLENVFFVSKYYK